MQIQPGMGPETTAFDLARATCALWGQCDFDEELATHYQEGYVAVMPHLFLMAKPLELIDGRRAWLITHAVGNLPLLLSLAPFHLEWVAFRRRDDYRMRIYRTDRLMHLAILLSEKEPI